MKNSFCRLVCTGLLLLLTTGCIRIYINDDHYRGHGRYDQQQGRYPPFEAARTPPDSGVLAYEIRAVDLQQATGRYLWVIPDGNVCALNLQHLERWLPFIDSLQRTGRAEVRWVFTNYNSLLLRTFRSWLDERGLHQPIFVLQNAYYGNKYTRKMNRFRSELTGQKKAAPFAPLEHVLIDPSGRCVYMAREDEDPKSKEAKPRAQIEAELRQLLAH